MYFGRLQVWRRAVLERNVSTKRIFACLALLNITVTISFWKIVEMRDHIVGQGSVHTRTSLCFLVFFQTISFPSYSHTAVTRHYLPGRLSGRTHNPQYPNFSFPQSGYQALVQIQDKEWVWFSWKAREGPEFVQRPTVFKLLSKLFLQYCFSVGYHSGRL